MRPLAHTMKDTLSKFAGKAVSFILIGEDNSRLLIDPHFESQCGRLFVVGKSPPGASKHDWIAGLDEALAWDCVQEYVVFESADCYFKRLTIQTRKKGRRKE